MSSDYQEDSELLIRKAFETDVKKGCELLFRRYYQTLCSYVAGLVYSRQVAEDIVAEVFCRFYENRTYQYITTSYRAYLFTGVRSKSLNHLQREFGKSRQTTSVYEQDVISQLSEPDQLLQYDELYLKIEATIHLLTPAVQKVFLLSRFEGKKNSVIAKELQLSVKTVEAHITKALHLLNKALSSQLLMVLICIYVRRMYM
jgi:RNA polymerase sigma-70 factor (ECF subfamily)